MSDGVIYINSIPGWEDRREGVMWPERTWIGSKGKESDRKVSEVEISRRQTTTQEQNPNQTKSGKGIW